MSESKTSKELPPTTSAECPICYEPFQSPTVSRRMLSCGHTFCHDCLVKCLLAARDDGRLHNSLICPICRFVTLLCKKRSLWPSKPAPTPQAQELPLSPASLPCGTANTLVVPSHWLMPVHGYDNHQSVCGCPSANSMVRPGGLERESHIFIISRCGMPLIEEDYSTMAQGSNLEAPGPELTHNSLGIGCLQSPIILAILLVSTVALLGAVLPWLLLVRKDE
ncbi:RING finger protein 222 [Tiliqua scincoides]|uniref:RING finger protein 222 n=1 Tax=Tiliqua scincoides TaxID=71010 RepID=UPI00346274BB